jgi:hypothetical protein
MHGRSAVRSSTNDCAHSMVSLAGSCSFYSENHWSKNRFVQALGSISNSNVLRTDNFHAFSFTGKTEALFSFSQPTEWFAPSLRGWDSGTWSRWKDPAFLAAQLKKKPEAFAFAAPASLADRDAPFILPARPPWRVIWFEPVRRSAGDGYLLVSLLRSSDATWHFPCPDGKYTGGLRAMWGAFFQMTTLYVLFNNTVFFYDCYLAIA